MVVCAGRPQCVFSATSLNPMSRSACVLLRALANLSGIGESPKPRVKSLNVPSSTQCIDGESATFSPLGANSIHMGLLGSSAILHMNDDRSRPTPVTQEPRMTSPMPPWLSQKIRMGRSWYLKTARRADGDTAKSSNSKIPALVGPSSIHAGKCVEAKLCLFPTME